MYNIITDLDSCQLHNQINPFRLVQLNISNNSEFRMNLKYNFNMQKTVHTRLLQPQIYHILSVGRTYIMKKNCISQNVSKDNVLLYFFHVSRNSFSTYLILEKKFCIYTYWYEIIHPL